MLPSAATLPIPHHPLSPYVAGPTVGVTFHRVLSIYLLCTENRKEMPRLKVFKGINTVPTCCISSPANIFDIKSWW